MKNIFPPITIVAIVLLLILTQCKMGNEKNQRYEINSSNKIKYRSRELTFVQEILDSSNTTRGKLYVEQISDSIFKRLYIFDGTDLKYFVGDGLLTNFVDTTKAVTDYFGIKFTTRNKYSFEIVLADKDEHYASDPWTIEYIRTKKRFDNPNIN